MTANFIEKLKKFIDTSILDKLLNYRQPQQQIHLNEKKPGL